MLSKQDWDALAVISGIKADVLAKAISDEQEVNLEFPKGRYLTKEQEDIILDNHGKRKYDEGISKALKVAFEGKSKEDFLADFSKEKIRAALEEAKVEPNKKIAELNDSLDKLRDQLNDKDAEYEKLQKSIEKEKYILEAQSYIPELSESIGLKKSEAVSLILSGVEKKEDGIYKNGELLKDSYESAISLETFIKDSVEQRGWTNNTPKGRGGGSNSSNDKSSTVSTPKTMQEFEAILQEKGIHAGSAEAQALLNEAAKQTPEILEL